MSKNKLRNWASLQNRPDAREPQIPAEQGEVQAECWTGRKVWNNFNPGFISNPSNIRHQLIGEAQTAPLDLWLLLFQFNLLSRSPVNWFGDLSVYKLVIKCFSFPTNEVNVFKCLVLISEKHDSLWIWATSRFLKLYKNYWNNNIVQCLISLSQKRTKSSYLRR